MNMIVKMWKTLRGQYTIVEDVEKVYTGIIFVRNITKCRDEQFYASLTKIDTFYKVKKFLHTISDNYDLSIFNGLIPESHVRIVSVDNTITKRKVYK